MEGIAVLVEAAANGILNPENIFSIMFAVMFYSIIMRSFGFALDYMRYKAGMPLQVVAQVVNGT